MKNDNAPVSRRLRFEVLRRDGFRCRYCGRPGSESGEGLTVDHVIPRALGGTNDPSNLVAACQDCNAGKSSASPDDQIVADVDESALRWAGAISAAHETASADLSRFDRDTKAFRTAWRKNALGPLPAGWEDSVRRFLAEGFQRSDLLHFLPVIANRPRINEYDHFRYFCGCINGEREKRVGLAREAVGPTEAATVGVAWEQALYLMGDALENVGLGRWVAGLLAEVVSDHGADGGMVQVGYADHPGSSYEFGGWEAGRDSLESYDAATGGGHGGYLKRRPA